MDRLSEEVSELKQQMERLALHIARSSTGMAGIAADPELARIFALLTNAEVDAELAYEIAGKMTPPATTQSLRRELGNLLSVDSTLGCPGSSPRTVALVGPPGAGKTTTLVKLAFQFGINARKPAHFLTLDTYRIAAVDQLQSFAALLGIGCQVAETPSALAQALEENRNKELILIDTPGFAPGEAQCFEEMAAFLATYPGMDIHLVLPASMRTADLKRTARNYEMFRPRKLIFTRLDETETFGPILSHSARMGIPVSFLSRGQQIPEDLQTAEHEAILDMVLKQNSVESSRVGMAAA
jgi:flagellar biosynthesis protein FlhF